MYYFEFNTILSNYEICTKINNVIASKSLFEKDNNCQYEGYCNESAFELKNIKPIGLRCFHNLIIKEKIEDAGQERKIKISISLPVFNELFLFSIFFIICLSCIQEIKTVSTRCILFVTLLIIQILLLLLTIKGKKKNYVIEKKRIVRIICS